MADTCAHIDSIDTSHVKQPTKRECEECVKIGDRWLHLRTCQKCGVTLCCDSSPNQHASKHARATFVDFREVAPGTATHDMYLDASGKPTRDSVEGWRSAAVPGMVRGMEMALTKYGARSWADNIAPSIELAGKGIPVSYALAASLKGSKSLASSPESKHTFQKDGAFFQIGDTLVQPELAQTLTRIAKNGPNEFYEGETARHFADEMAKHGGLITTADLKAYRAIERKPLVGMYHGYEVITAPPSSSGGIALLEMLGILDRTSYDKGGAGSASDSHSRAEAMRRSYAHRHEDVM